MKKLVFSIIACAALGFSAKAQPASGNPFGTSGGSGNGSGTNNFYIYTNGMPGSEVTNVVAAFTTNKIDNLNGRGTNLWTTNFAMHGTVGATNTTFKFHEPQTNQNINTWYSFGDAAGGTRNWQQVVGTNRWYIQNGSGVTAIPFQLHGNGLGNVTLGHNTSSTTTNAGDLRVLGVAYDANGNSYSTNIGGGSQTPWTQNINGDNYSLTNAGDLKGGGQLVMDYAYLLPDSNEVGLAIAPLTGASNPLQIQDTNSAAALYVTPNGNVGIKTNAPSASLEVQGSIRSSLGITNTAGVSFASGNLTADSGGNLTTSSGNSFNWAGSFGLGNGASASPNFYGNGFTDLTALYLGNRDASSIGLVFSNTVATGVGMYARDGFLTNSINLAARSYILETTTNTVTAPVGLYNTGAQIWSDGTNLCVVLQNTAGTRTTNKLTMSAWP